MTDTQECATGCKSRGNHASDCTNPCSDDCDRRCREHCRGCQARRAVEGLSVCKGCVQKINSAVAKIPRLVAWISVHDVPSSGSAPSKDFIKRTKKAPPLPFRADAVDDADELHALLVSWCQTVADEHPHPLAGPDLRGSRITHKANGDPTGRVVGLAVSVRTWRGADWSPSSAQANTDTVPYQAATERAAKWMLAQLAAPIDNPLSHAWSSEMVAEICEAVRMAERRWPTEPQPEVMDPPCLDCRGQLVKQVHEIADDAGDDRFVCRRCKRVYTLRDYNLALGNLLRERAAERESEAGETA